MGRIMLAFLMLISVAQAQPGYTRINMRYVWIGGGFDSVLVVPGYSTTPTGLRSALTRAGQLGVDSVNNRLFFYSSGTWQRIPKSSEVLAPSDTVGKWVNRVYRKPGSDSVFTCIGSTCSFAFIDTSTGSGVTPTLQQVLNAGSTLNTDNEIDAGGYLFSINNCNEFQIGDNIGIGSNKRFGFGPTATYIYGEPNDLGEDDTRIELTKDSITLYPLYGKLYIDTLTAQHNVSDSMMVWHPTTGKVGYRAIPSGSSGANTALSNLSSVAINTSLLPGTTNSIDLGSSSYQYNGLYLNGSSSTGIFFGGGGKIWDDGSKMRITATGAIQILNSGVGFEIYNSGGTADLNVTYNALSTIGQNNLQIQPGGSQNVKIGSGTASEKLDVTGNIIASGTITPSDARYKIGIRPQTNAVSLLMKLRPSTYRMNQQDFPEKQFDSNIHHGLVAQELEKVFPELVKTYGDGFKGVNYSELIPVLIAAIQEQQKQIDELKKELRKRAH